MASCAYCSSIILFGGKKRGDLRFCNAECAEKGLLTEIANRLPQAQVAQYVAHVHGGTCPVCGKSGPVDVHTSYRVYSLVLFSSWSSRPAVCCQRCGIRKKAGDMLFSLFLGWWGFPWGILMTPVQVGRNLFGFVLRPDPTRPSKALEKILARWGNLWVVFGGSLSDAHVFRPIRYRARRGQGTCPQDKPVGSRCAVRDLPTAPRLEAFGLTRLRLPTAG